MAYKDIIRRRLVNFIEWQVRPKKTPPIEDGKSLKNITGYDNPALAGTFYKQLKKPKMGFKDVLDHEKTLPVPKENTKFSALVKNIVEASDTKFLTDKNHYRNLRRNQIATTFPKALGDFAKQHGVELDPATVTDEKSVPGLLADIANFQNSTVLSALDEYLETIYMQHLLSDIGEFELSGTVKEAKHALVLLMVG